ncbi:MAG: selenocysteine-specific translation elongation factor [Acidobacteriota bacterium]
MTHLVVGTAGHIDHGKSSLVLALTGTDPDRLKEEKARGITIELGFAHARVGDATVAFVDVPGHERFVRTMLAGVGGIDAVLLVVAADESVMPQTREHFDICRLLRVRRGLVAITKADLVDDDTLALVGLEVADLVQGSFLEGAPVLPVSARTGLGLDALRHTLADLAAAGEDRPATGPARLPIDRVFTMAGFGTVVTGTLVSGRLDVEQELAIEPGGRRARVRGLQVHGRREATAVAGQRVAVNLGGVEIAEVHRGQTLVTPDAFVVTRRLDAVLELLADARPLKHGARVRVHQGTSEVLARVSLAGPPRPELPPGATAPVRLRLEAPAVVTRGDRLILRAYSPPRTVGGGQVVDPAPPRGAIRTEAALARFAALAPAAQSGIGDMDALRQMVREAGLTGLDRTALVARAGVAPADADAVEAALTRDNHISVAGPRLVWREALDAAANALLAAVGDHHRAHPLDPGLPREEARARVFARADAAVFDAAVQQLVAARKLVARDRLALAGHQLALSPEEEAARGGVEAAYRRAGLRPPDAATVAAEAGVPPAVAERMTALLIRQKTLVRLDTLTFHAEALASLKADLQSLKQGQTKATVDVAMFKERYGVTRKYAIPLLEWLDRERVTRRVGEARMIL